MIALQKYLCSLSEPKQNAVMLLNGMRNADISIIAAYFLGIVDEEILNSTDSAQPEEIAEVIREVDTILRFVKLSAPT
jgi:hypothetical protein